MKKDHETLSQIFDTGRRGSPQPGCDCVQCFGYCQTDRDKVVRDQYARGKLVAMVREQSSLDAIVRRPLAYSLLAGDS